MPYNGFSARDNESDGVRVGGLRGLGAATNDIFAISVRFSSAWYSCLCLGSNRRGGLDHEDDA
jgi:hypothetical protein